MQGRRESDRRPGRERRRGDRRQGGWVHTASWDEQRVQYCTRYLFWVLYLLYFRLGQSTGRALPGKTAIEAAGGAYFVLTTAYLLHARRHLRSVARWRLAMWTDLLMVSFSVLMDPHPMSPAYLAYIMVILGNGMRYGMRLFAETLIGTFSLVAIITILRSSSYLHAISPTTTFFLAFFAIIIVYAYSLMSRIEKTRLQLEAESHRDLLTGLLNRRGLQERTDMLFQELDRAGGQAAVLFADLDRFKAINDVLGHHAGDRVLREIGDVIRTAVRESDIAARFGGDEFVIVMPDSDADKAMLVARRLQDAVARRTNGGNVALSVSIGIGVMPQDGRDLGSVLRRVDIAMYQGKQADGRGGIRHAGQLPEPA
ncbi:MAG: GGDEF domain-containing protein [Gammaproteobacteria bacterium]|nr:GGDEF domain-containing protein [Gammaproteobacteria bacterium]